MSEEYTVELYLDLSEKDKHNWRDSWQSQEYIGNTYEECEQWIEAHPVEEPYYYSIWCIEYDENGEEVAG